MISQEVAMGVGLVMLGLYFAGRAPWIVGETRKGQWLATRFGEPRAIQITRLIAISFALLGVMLAIGVVQPMRWQ